MGNPDTEPLPPDDLSEDLVRRIDALELSELKSLRSYVGQRIDALRTPIEAAIESTAAGEVLDIENHGAYAIVRQHPPDPEGGGVDTGVTSLYHVRREPRFDGSESLHWAYLGDVHDRGENRCESCGRTLGDGVESCPHCSGDAAGTEE